MLVAPVVLKSPVRNVRSVPPVERTPTELVPVVETDPMATVAAWPGVITVTPLAALPPVVAMLMAVLPLAFTKLSGPVADVKVTAGAAVVARVPDAT